MAALAMTSLLEAANASLANASLADADAGGVAPLAAPSTTVGLLWFFAIALMVFAQHHVCDAYFVPAINVFVATMKGSKNKWWQRLGEDAVAGATICALGCNGPELFTNLVGLYVPGAGDAGFGVVVGSEIFNLLIIVGAAVLAAPRTPLAIEKGPFTRDCLYYAFSIGLLYVFLKDGKITWHEALTLLGAALAYTTTVYFTTEITSFFPGGKSVEVEQPDSEQEKSTTAFHGVEVYVEELFHGRMADSRAADSIKVNLEALDRGIVAQPMQKRKSSRTSENNRGSVGLHFDEGGMLGPVLMYKDLKEVVTYAEGIIAFEFLHNQVQHVTLKITLVNPKDRPLLLENVKNHSKTTYVCNYDATIFGAIGHFKHAMLHGSCADKIFAVPEFIVDFLLKLTLFWVDVKDVQHDHRKEGRWPLCFCGAMAWLGCFSFLMLQVAVQISYNIPALPMGMLGITVCAIGTSFPNAVASIIMAQQDKPAAAIANALGSNVQNVFLAMALPWVIKCITANEDYIDMASEHIITSVLWMLFTLLLLIFLVLMPQTCFLNKCNGLFLIFVYFVFLTQYCGGYLGWWGWPID